MFKNFAIGIDIEENSRFENKSEEFLKRIFTEGELNYCLKNRNSSQYLCARFCAKEAVIKAFGGLGINDLSYMDVEILKNENSSPKCVVKKYPEIEVKISISHSKNYSTANAFAFLL